ncbi:Bug family tripartite tricarboxylate transporter substrate binding protein [Candidimonas nitroreducens]|uniref:ABC transporter substrate-binding protein n=1 Tax=Candidimonas nitroreducens TaxID=683354 RepID=A0A225MG87_9BURK|nr:tripartite tricarboxylate transporter substrate binding protein [Candidimonas nitroreducens]OWT59253.1 ABC transporter substrate-binding protein [Candidimonas nitroreducens]
MNEFTSFELSRRRLILSMLAGGATAALPSIANSATDFPKSPVKLVVPFPPGGGTDTLARLVADELSKQMGHGVIVENKGGAGGIIGAKEVMRAAPDGYTILLTATGQVIDPIIHRTPSYDILKDFTPICHIGYVPQLVLVKSDFPAHTFQEFVALAKKRPKELSWATSGFGTAGHFAEELINLSSGIDMQIVAYRGGGPALTDLVGGHVNAMVEPLPSSIPHVKSGRLKALAVTSQNRASALPDVPTVAESGIPNFEMPSWYGIWGPAKLPPDVTQKIYQGVKRSLEAPKLKNKLQNLSFVVVAGSPSEFDGFIRSEFKKYSQIAKSTGIMID